MNYTLDLARPAGERLSQIDYEDGDPRPELAWTVGDWHHKITTGGSIVDCDPLRTQPVLLPYLGLGHAVARPTEPEFVVGLS